MTPVHGHKKPKFGKVLLKLSGEALAGDSELGIEPKVLQAIALEVAQLRGMGVQIGIVIGGGNLFRGAALQKAGMDRIAGDHMGMLATVMNGIAVRDALEQLDIPTRLMSAIPMTGVVDAYDRLRAVHDLKEGFVVIFCAGTGNPFFTTDTAACLRAIEIDAALMLKATKVDGVYSADPQRHSEVTRYEHLSFEQAIRAEFGIMDLTALTLARDHQLPIVVFKFGKPGALASIVTGGTEGTLIGGVD